MSRFRKAIPAIALGVLLFTACSSTTEGKFGGELYETACAGCHASDGSGGRGPAIATPDADAVKLTDDQIRGVIRVGPGAMPAWSRLTDEQVDSLIVYLRALQRGD